MKSNLKIAAVLPLCFSLLFSACQNSSSGDKNKEKTAETTEIYVRRNAQIPAALPDIEAMDRALKKMRELPCTNPVSWYYQGAMHWIPSSIPNGNPLCPEYQDSTQAMTAWMNCTHAPGSELHFLIWHRLYIYYFEKAVREFSGKKDFALPYWDYTNTSYRTMPEMFRKKESSLYTAARLDSLNEGDTIGSFMDPKLDVTDLFENRIYSVFNGNIDKAPHGAMHNYIGGAYADISVWNEIYQTDNVGLMAEVASAAFDPIFWLHHSNIDYLWQTWESSPNGARPSLKVLEEHPWGYTFFEPDGSKVELTVAQAYDMAFNKMDYVYEVPEREKPLLAAASEVELQDQTGPEVLASVKPVQKIEKANTRFSLDLSAGHKKLSQKTEGKEQVILLVVKTSFSEEPDRSYDVFIREQGAKDALVSEENRAGIMTFFGAAHHATQHGGHDHGHQHGDKMTSTFTFDITNEIDLTRFNGKLDVEVRRLGKETREEIVIEEVSLQRVILP